MFCVLVFSAVLGCGGLWSTAARAALAPSEFCNGLQTGAPPAVIWVDAQWFKSYGSFNDAKALDNQGAYSAAITQYQNGLQAFPTDVEQRLRLGVDYDRVGKTTAADVEWRQAIDTAARGGIGENRYCEGDKLFRARAFRSAFEAYFRAQYPANGDLAGDMNVLYLDLHAAPLIKEGLTLAAEGEYQEAMSRFAGAEKLAPSLQMSNFFLAATKFQTGDMRAARTYWEAVIDNSGTRTPEQHGPDRIQIAAATLLLWMDHHYRGWESPNQTGPY